MAVPPALSAHGPRLMCGLLALLSPHDNDRLRDRYVDEDRERSREQVEKVLADVQVMIPPSPPTPQGVVP